MKRVACLILIATILASGLIFVPSAHATSVGGNITDNTEWALANSPFTFNSSVFLAYNATLTIDPGVTVNMGTFSLYVYGTLIAAGQSGNQITFTGSGTYPNSIGFSLYYLPNGTTTSVASIIQKAALSGINLQMFSESPTIDSCTISSTSQSYGSVISVNGGSPTISNNVISCNSLGSSSSLMSLASVTGGGALVTNNTFEGSYLASRTNDIMVTSGSPTITYNTFSGTYITSDNNGITVQAGASPQISNNKFNGNNYMTAIDTSYISGGSSSSSVSFSISNNIFFSCSVGIKAQSGSTLTVQGNSFLGGTDGIDIDSTATLTITNNLIDSNSRYGIDGGGYITSNTITNNKVGIHNPTICCINDNNIVGNTQDGITTASANVDATNNWWGTTDVPTINQTIYDGKVDPHLGNVTFVPFLTSPNQSAPTIPNTTPTITPVPTQAPPPTPIPEPPTPTPTPYQFSQTFIYQVGTLVNIHLFVTVTAVVLILVWLLVILGYTTKSLVSRYQKKNSCLH